MAFETMRVITVGITALLCLVVCLIVFGARVRGTWRLRAQLREGYPATPPHMVTTVPTTPPYRESDAAVFQAYLRTHGSAPTDLAMRHYAYIKRRDGLDERGVAARIKRDLDESSSYMAGE